MDDNASEQQDNETIKLVLNGNAEAFEVLLTRYENYVFKIVSRHVPYDAVRDVAHEVFVKAYLSLGSFAYKASFKNWLSKIAVRNCYDFWREHYKKQEIPMSSFTEDHQKWFDAALSVQSQRQFEQLENQKETREVLQLVLKGLSAEDRMVLSLIYLEDHSVRETADILGWSVVNVKVRAHRLRSRLREKILKLALERTDL